MAALEKTNEKEVEKKIKFNKKLLLASETAARKASRDAAALEKRLNTLRAKVKVAEERHTLPQKKKKASAKKGQASHGKKKSVSKKRR